ncbi:hypothetical protein ILUMI_09752 [Ignelater luminosus]|uniref:Uncharacterized protein n=1 Tax=Ignelater luminosus TaxID=2038154 RepID=A0A8K0CZ57_IGNLU|nr:hypothetical protein ILUMI_09752 [Ignelater luminosus]
MFQNAQLSKTGYQEFVLKINVKVQKKNGQAVLESEQYALGYGGSSKAKNEGGFRLGWHKPHAEGEKLEERILVMELRMFYDLRSLSFELANHSSPPIHKDKKMADVSFMLPLSTYLLNYRSSGLLLIPQMRKLFDNAFIKTDSIQTAVNGFKKAGIHPLNPKIFLDWMVEPAETTSGSMEDYTVKKKKTLIHHLKFVTFHQEHPRSRGPYHQATGKEHSSTANVLCTAKNTSGRIDAEQFYANGIPSCSDSINTFVGTLKQVVSLPHV